MANECITREKGKNSERMWRNNCSEGSTGVKERIETKSGLSEPVTAQWDMALGSSFEEVHQPKPSSLQDGTRHCARGERNAVSDLKEFSVQSLLVCKCVLE